MQKVDYKGLTFEIDIHRVRMVSPKKSAYLYSPPSIHFDVYNTLDVFISILELGAEMYNNRADIVCEQESTIDRYVYPDGSVHPYIWEAKKDSLKYKKGFYYQDETENLAHDEPFETFEEAEQDAKKYADYLNGN